MNTDFINNIISSDRRGPRPTRAHQPISIGEGVDHG